jgi:hypothetical protein
MADEERRYPGEPSETIKSRLHAQTDAAYRRLADEARVNKALADLAARQFYAAAGTGGKAAEATIRQRSENNLRSLLGKARKLRDDYKKNVDLALEKLSLKTEADKSGSAGRMAAKKGLARLSQHRADADLGLQRQQFDLYKNDSDFNKAYRMYLNRMIKKNAFKGMTGIEVKNLPAKKKKPLIIQLKQTDPATKSPYPDYTLISSINPDTSMTKYLVSNKLISDAEKAGVALKDNTGRLRDERVLRRDVYREGVKPSIVQEGAKESRAAAKDPDYVKLAFSDNNGRATACYVKRDLYEFAKGRGVDLEFNGKPKTGMQIMRELFGVGSDGNLDYAQLAKNLKSGGDKIIDMFGIEDYKILSAYAPYRAAYEPLKHFGLSLDSGMAALDDLVMNSEANRALLGEDEYYRRLQNGFDALKEQLDIAADIRQRISESDNAYSASSIIEAFPEYEDADTDEDKMRKAMDIVPKAFDVESFEKSLKKNRLEEQLKAQPLKFISTLVKYNQAEERAERIVEVQRQPSDSFESDLFYIIYGHRPDAAELDETLHRLGLMVHSNTPKAPELTDNDKLFVEMYNQTIDSIYNHLNARQKTRLRTDVARYVSYSGVDIWGNIEGYRRLFEDVYGYYPNTDDMMALSNRLQYGSLGNVSVENLGKEIDGGGGGGGNGLNEQDEQYLRSAVKYAISANSANDAIARLKGEKKEAVTEMIGGAAGRGSDAFLTGLGSTGLAGFEMLGGYFVDNNAPGRMRGYLNEMKDARAGIYAETLKNAQNYAPWMTTGQDIGAGIFTTAETLMLGNIAGAITKAAGSATALANPTVSKSFVQTVAPNATLKVMFFEQYGETLTKYEKMGTGGMAPVYALLDAGLNTYIESLGGVMSEGSAFEAGIKALSDSKALNLALDFIEEMGEEGVQSIASSALEAVASAKHIEESPSFLNSGDILETGISVAIMVGLFGLAGKGCDISSIEDAYKNGEYVRAAELTLELINETREKGGLYIEDAKTFELVEKKLSEELAAMTEQEQQFKSVTGDITVPELPKMYPTQIQGFGRDTEAPAIVQAENNIDEAINTLDSIGIDTAAASRANFDYLTAGAKTKQDAFVNAADVVLNTIDTAIEAQQTDGLDTYHLESLKEQVEQAKQSFINAVEISGNNQPQSSMIAEEKAMADGLSFLMQLPPDLQIEGNTESARKTFYKSLTADKTSKAAAHKAAIRQLNESISSALASGKLSAEQTARLREVKAEIEGDIDIREGAGDNKSKETEIKPYAKGRPSLRKGVVISVWENAKGSDGLVRDPHTKEVIYWEPEHSRKGIWDMGHIKGQKYSDMYKRYMKGMMSVEEFRNWYNDYRNYHPELPGTNRSHRFE